MAPENTARRFATRSILRQVRRITPLPGFLMTDLRDGWTGQGVHPAIK